MRTNRLVLSASLALALAAGFALSRTAKGDQGDADGVAASCKAFKQAWNAHDANALAAVFSDDSDVTHIDPMGKVDEGKPQIQAMLTAMFGPKGAMRDSTLVVSKEIARFPTPDTAVTDADATITGAYGPDGSKGPAMDFHVVNVWKKSGGKWSVFACRPTMKPAAPATK